MGVLAELLVGPRAVTDGAQIGQRADRSGGTVVQDAHARFTEAVARGNCFMAANQTGVTTQAGLSATTPALTLYNPSGNNKVGVLIYAGGLATVAFIAASVLWIGANTNLSAAAVTGTAATVRNALIGNAGVPSLSAFTAATLPAAPVAIATIGVGLTGAITTVPNAATLGRMFDGTICIYPGAAISFQTSTASGASGFFGEFIWEEIAL